MVNIPVNTYQVPTECREEVVQMIVDAFLEGLKGVNAKNYNYNTLKLGYCTDVYVTKCTNRKGEETACLHWETFPKGYEIRERYRIRSCEVDAAIKGLHDAGYHIYEYRDGWNGKHFTIGCKDRPIDLRTNDDAREITSFNFKID